MDLGDKVIVMEQTSEYLGRTGTIVRYLGRFPDQRRWIVRFADKAERPFDEGELQIKPETPDRKETIMKRREYGNEELAEMEHFLDDIGLNGPVTAQKAKEMASLFTTVIWDHKFTRDPQGVLAKLRKMQLERRRVAGIVPPKTDKSNIAPPDSITEESLDTLVCSLVKQARLVNEATMRLFKIAESIKTALEHDRQRLRAYTQIREIIEKDVPEILKTR